MNGIAGDRSRACIRCIFPVAVAVFLLGCAETSNPGPPRNLLLISLDTVRKDHLAMHGYERDPMPTLERLAASGTLFDHALAVSPWTRPSHVSLVTGLYPRRHGARSFATTQRAGLVTLQQVLREAGFETGAVVSSGLLEPKSGFDRGFDFFRYHREWAAGKSGVMRSIDPGRAVTNDAVAWLSRRGARPFFLLVHYYDAHSDYAPGLPARRAMGLEPGSDAPGETQLLLDVLAGRRELAASELERMMALYDAGLRQVDEEIAALLLALGRSGLRDSTAIVVTADHGEEFMEHGGVLHARTFYSEVIDIPLVLAGPGIPTGMRSQRLASHVDVAPTALALLGMTIPEEMQGIDLLAPEAPNPTARFVFGEADHSNAVPDQFQMVRSQHFKLIMNRRSGQTRLYDLREDPKERKDLSASQPDVLSRHLAALADFESVPVTSGSARAPSPEEREALRTLGYLE